MKHFKTTQAPLCRPFPWPKPNKLHIQMHPPVIWGYWLIKYQNNLLLNWELWPSDRIQCWFSLNPIVTIFSQCKNRQCCTK
jgi:hypothetical protein